MGIKIKGYHLCKPFWRIKQYSIWGSSEPNTNSILIYLQRPRWIKDDTVWESIVKGIRLELPMDFEVK